MMSDHNRQPDDGSSSDSRKAVVDKVLDGADEVTRGKMDAMLERSSVVEVMAQAHASGKPAAIEDRPIKPDFLNTDQYRLAREAIGAKGEPPPMRLELSPSSPSKDGPVEGLNADALPSPPAPSRTPDQAPPPPEEGSTWTIAVMVAAVAALVVAVIVLWPTDRGSAETKPTGSAAATSPAANPTPAQTGSLPEPRPAPSPSTPSSATTRAAPPQPSAPSAPDSSLSPNAPPTPGPSATTAPEPSSTSRFPVQGDD